MRKYFEVDPEVPGFPLEIPEAKGEGSSVNAGSLHFVFQGWMGDQLMTGWPVFLATRSLAQAFEARGLSGFEIDSVNVTKSPRLDQLRPLVELPPLVWLKIDGVYGQSDFFLDEGALVVSEEALKIILETKPTMLMHGQFEED